MLFVNCIAYYAIFYNFHSAPKNLFLLFSSFPPQAHEYNMAFIELPKDVSNDLCIQLVFLRINSSVYTPGSHLKYQFSQLAALKFFNGSSENLVLREQKILLWLLILLSLVAVILPTYLFYLLRLSKTCGL